MSGTLPCDMSCHTPSLMSVFELPHFILLLTAVQGDMAGRGDAVQRHGVGFLSIFLPIGKCCLHC